MSLFLVCAGVGCGGRSGDARGVRGHAGRGDCERLRDRLVEIRLQGVSLDREVQRRAIAASLGEGFMHACVDTMSAREVACGRDARDAAALAACTRP